MKDGTPLIDEDDEPNFIAMPSESLEHAEDEPEDVTIVRKSTPPIPPPAAEPVYPPPTPQPRSDAGARIVVSTEPDVQRPAAQTYRAAAAEPPKSNTVKVVILTVFGTLFVLAIGALGFWGLQKLAGGSDANSNVNANANVNLANEDTNVNTNLGIDSNFNFNTGGFDTNSNSNSNSNDREKTPTPTPTATPTPRPSPSPTATPDRDDDDSNGDDGDRTPQPTPTPVRVRTPVPTPTPLIIRPAPDTRRTPNVRRRDDDK